MYRKVPLTLSPFLSLEPLGAVGGPGKESQSRRWQTSWLQSELHTLTLLSPLAHAHSHRPSLPTDDSWGRQIQNGPYGHCIKCTENTLLGFQASTSTWCIYIAATRPSPSPLHKLHMQCLYIIVRKVSGTRALQSLSDLYRLASHS